MKIMLGYNGFTPDSNIAMTTLNHAKAFQAQVHLVTSMQVGEDIPKTDFDDAEETLEKGKKFFLERDIDCVTTLLETGSKAGEDLVQFASEYEMDLLIIGVKNRSKLGKLIFGSTAQYVILKASCPVLSIKDEDE